MDKEYIYFEYYILISKLDFFFEIFNEFMRNKVKFKHGLEGTENV